jgi:hypothetical protein
MIDFAECRIEKVSVHTVGNKTNGEKLRLSNTQLDISETKVKELLKKFFVSSFANPEFYSFTFTNEDFTLNPIFTFASKIFDDSRSLHRTSVSIAKHLYELSLHPQIKSGDLFVAYFTDANIDNTLTDAIGIFKSENRQAFLKVDTEGEEFSIACEDGINIEKLDKGCIIFNVDSKEGFKVCVIDKSNKSVEAQYWKDTFLQVKPCSDTYHHTKEFMNLTKDFVTKQMADEFVVSKADQIDLLNRSVEYFKSHDTFDTRQFENEVFQDKKVIKSFRDFNEAFKQTNDLELDDSFEISQHAVKKQSRVFKSVLKLDKNFHIYIHGDRELIEQGVEQDGRKYYKIYFQQES